MRQCLQYLSSDARQHLRCSARLTSVLKHNSICCVCSTDGVHGTATRVAILVVDCAIDIRQLPLLCFYCTSHMHSTDYVVIRCLSITCRYFVKNILRLFISLKFLNIFFWILKFFFTIGWPDLSSFSVPNGMLILRRGPPNGGVECEGVWKKWQFSTNISLYLQNDTRHSHSYYGRRIGNCIQAFEWCHFQFSML